jgi:hypothetical protein
MDSGKKALFYDFTEENMQSIVEGIIKIRDELWKYKNRGINQLKIELKQVPDWKWMKKNQYYLVTNLTVFFLINRFESETEFWYYEVGTYNSAVNLGTLRDENEIESNVTKLINRNNGNGSWQIRFTGDAERWVKGLIIPINNKKSKFMNWTNNPLEVIK